jgi:RNA polymerase sigma-70 factor, ECF subfamily
MEITGIYTQFHRALLSFIRSRIRSREDAEDILQNVFIKISTNVNTLSNEEKLRSWIFTITRNSIIDYYRKRGTHKKVEVSEEIEDLILDEHAPDSTQGLEECIGAMITLLPDEYREIVVDAELKGISQKDLAEKYNMAYPSMRSRVQRGRERLKQLFYNCCHIETDSMGNVLSAHGKAGCEGPCNPCSD